MLPLVSAIMVTGKTPARAPFARAAIRSFQLQNWPNKELVIVNDSQQPLFFQAELPPNVREVMANKQPLGELRNVGLAAAQGEWVMQWDDDDWSHPDRMSWMMEYRKEHHAMLLLWQIRYSFVSNNAFVLQYDRPTEGIPGTVLHPNIPGLKYTAEGRHEDSHFLNDNFGDRRVILANDGTFPGPALYLRFHHAADNTWSERHIMRRYTQDSMRDTWNVNMLQAKYLREVLHREYGHSTKPRKKG